jgi:hypothetical protein
MHARAYRRSKYVVFGVTIFIEECSYSAETQWYLLLTYTVEIELPGSGNWFRYFAGIESRKEAESIRRVAEGKVKARVRNGMNQGL